ncbi:MAG TPA: 5-formyltetrahydrofolate cyclo-ligase [Chitinophagaceae bacterium]|nr:5-formyltetrahydrofolate cyclo-ligase [Chitinophagaceae bacterium]
MTKSAIRTIYKDKRTALSDKDRMKLDDLILIEFQKLSLPDASFLLSYWPIPSHNEVNTLPIADYLLFRMPGLQLAYPRTSFETLSMQAVLVNDDTEYEVNSHGISEPVDGEQLSPEELDIIFVPMLAYDKQGYRVGYGKGFYDRYLQQCKPGILKIGFSYFEPEPVISDVNEFDIPLNLVITPERIYEF